MFIEDVRRSDVEVTIVGKIGRNYFLNEEPGRPYTYFELPDSGTDRAKLSELVRHLVQYEEMYVYFGEFKNVARQTPTKMVISARTLLANLTSGSGEENRYIFEPSLEKILMFFETEIFASLLDQTVAESQLAKFASRILAMNKAHENIDNKLKVLSMDALRVKHRIRNREQLDSMSSISMWNK
jgi:F0F1-type ATP synthase gamma subunit